MTLTLRKPNSSEYTKFSDYVKQRAKVEYNDELFGDEEVIEVEQPVVRMEVLKVLFKASQSEI